MPFDIFLQVPRRIVECRPSQYNIWVCIRHWVSAGVRVLLLAAAWSQGTRLPSEG